ncbi:hypothetical protein LCGC14_2483950 [marine sediment metagenome]|uniref:Uncharacterized protein n=1 Tax=marine sediment metagenome TaxID=412755 RepID=A0A0F9B6P2_9ZZZZ
MQHWIVEASKVPRGKRQRVMEMMKTGSTVGETHEALELPLMVVVQITIEEYPTA